MSLRTTGGSTVDDADRTNSPISWSLVMSDLALDSELFGELVDPDLCHVSPVSAWSGLDRKWRGPWLVLGGAHR